MKRRATRYVIGVAWHSNGFGEWTAVACGLRCKITRALTDSAQSAWILEISGRWHSDSHSLTSGMRWCVETAEQLVKEGMR